jgi:hypothetical protein
LSTRLTAYTLSILLSLVLLLVTARAVGGAIRTSNFALFQGHQCSPEPCWHGIQPGITTIAQARAILAADHDLAANLATYYDNCWYVVSIPSWKICIGPLLGEHGDVIDYVYLRFESAQEAPHLGDVLTLFGEPVGSKLCWYRFGVGNNRSFIGADVYFENGLYVGAYNAHEPDSFRLDPNRTVFLVSYARRYRPRIPGWRGFVEQRNQQGC